MDIGEVISPWRVSLSHWTQELENGVQKYCGGDDSPILLTNPRTYKGFALDRYATLELELEEETAERLPIAIPDRGVLTQQDFPRLIEGIRKVNDARYGRGASTPVRVQEDAPR